MHYRYGGKMLQKLDLDNYLHSALQTAIGKLVGIITAPPDRTLPYAVMYPQGGVQPQGSWSSPEEDRWWTYQITSVGLTNVQTTWMSDQVRAFFLTPSHWPAAVTGGSIQGVVSVTLGAILPGGEDLYQIPDVYRVKAGR